MGRRKTRVGVTPDGRKLAQGVDASVLMNVASPRVLKPEEGPVHDPPDPPGMPRPIPDSRSRGERCCQEDPKVGLGSSQASDLAEAFRLLADPIRLQILDVLSRNEGRVCVCDLEAAVLVKQPTVSHHLAILRRAGIVESERQGVWAYYFLNRKRLDAMRRAVTDFLGPVAGGSP
jgi:ArsR family transcriptional regulator